MVLRDRDKHSATSGEVTTMSARDHSCEHCGRGGMNDPMDARVKRLERALSRVLGLAKEHMYSKELSLPLVIDVLAAAKKTLDGER